MLREPATVHCEATMLRAGGGARGDCSPRVDASTVGAAKRDVRRWGARLRCDSAGPAHCFWSFEGSSAPPDRAIRTIPAPPRTPPCWGSPTGTDADWPGMSCRRLRVQGPGRLLSQFAGEQPRPVLRLSPLLAYRLQIFSIRCRSLMIHSFLSASLLHDSVATPEQPPRASHDSALTVLPMLWRCLADTIHSTVH